MSRRSRHANSTKGRYTAPHADGTVRFALGQEEVAGSLDAHNVFLFVPDLAQYKAAASSK